MRTTLLFMLFAATAFSQNTIKVSLNGDSVTVENIEAPPSVINYQVIIQNNDDLTQSVYYWDDDGEGTFHSPYCNFRVTRTAFVYPFSTAITSNDEHFNQFDVSVKVSSIGGKKVLVKVEGADSFILSFHYIGGGNPYTFYHGFWQYWPSGTFSEGTYTFFIPYAVHGLQIARFIVKNGDCQELITRTFYTN